MNADDISFALRNVSHSLTLSSLRIEREYQYFVELLFNPKADREDGRQEESWEDDSVFLSCDTVKLWFTKYCLLLDAKNDDRICIEINDKTRGWNGRMVNYHIKHTQLSFWAVAA